jgi:hypothetical protein
MEIFVDLKMKGFAVRVGLLAQIREQHATYRKKRVSL